MNNAVQARPCWSLLANKAEEQLDLIRQEMVQTNHRLQQLQSSQQRLQGMYDEYCQQHNQPGSQSQGMRQAMGQRQFMSQLLSLLERVAMDLAHTRNLLDAYKERMIATEKERIKMRTLADKNQMELQAQANRREQRSLDEVGLMQFNRQAAT